LQDEVGQLLDWLNTEIRPEIVHLSNVMLAGLARPVKERLGVPVVATLTGEDGFLERLPQPYYDQALAELRARSTDIDCVIALSRDYADFMAGYLRLPREKIEVMRPGLNLEGFPAARSEKQGAGSTEKTVGYFGRICEEKGTHMLLAAMAALDDTPGLPPYRIRLAGYLDRADRRHLNRLLSAARRAGKADRFEYVGELDRAGKIAFLKSLDVLCLPSLLRESKGLPALEAWACGVPAVLPNHGVFSEMIADTGGGLLYDPQQPDGLARALARMLGDGELAAGCASNGYRAIHDRYTSEGEARDVLALYEKILVGGAPKAVDSRGLA
jgi:glycosyltransferase involved in cell wall biosynthesis